MGWAGLKLVKVGLSMECNAPLVRHGSHSVNIAVFLSE